MEPGTPEWQAEYDKEYARLDSAAGELVSTTETVQETVATEEAQPIVEEKPEEPKETEAERVLRQKLESTEKALKGQQRYASKLAREVEAIRRAQQEVAHKSQRPALLDQVEGLADSIAYVARTPREQLPVEQPFGPQWQSTVVQAIPDVDALLNNPQFAAKAAEMRDMNDWQDPVNAIRDLADLKAQYMMQRSATQAAEQARKDFEAKHKNLLAQKVPSGAGGVPAKPQAEVDEVKMWQDMPSDKFEERKRRIMGY